MEMKDETAHPTRVDSSSYPRGGRRVFISYSRDGSCELVAKKLHDELEKGTLDCRFDQEDGRNAPHVMSYGPEEVRQADWVLVLCTARYLVSASRPEDMPPGQGKGVASEWKAIQHRRLDDERLRLASVIPVLPEGEPQSSIPPELGGAPYYSLWAGVSGLVSYLLGQAAPAASLVGGNLSPTTGWGDTSGLVADWTPYDPAIGHMLDSRGSELPVNLATTWGLERWGGLFVVFTPSASALFTRFVKAEGALWDVLQRRTDLPPVPVRWWVEVRPNRFPNGPNTATDIWGEAVWSHTSPLATLLRTGKAPNNVIRGLMAAATPNDLSSNAGILSHWCSQLFQAALLPSSTRMLLAVESPDPPSHLEQAGALLRQLRLAMPAEFPVECAICPPAFPDSFFGLPEGPDVSQGHIRLGTADHVAHLISQHGLVPVLGSVNKLAGGSDEQRRMGLGIAVSGGPWADLLCDAWVKGLPGDIAREHLGETWGSLGEGPFAQPLALALLRSHFLHGVAGPLAVGSDLRDILPEAVRDLITEELRRSTIGRSGVTANVWDGLPDWQVGAEEVARLAVRAGLRWLPGDDLEFSGIGAAPGTVISCTPPRPHWLVRMLSRSMSTRLIPGLVTESEMASIRTNEQFEDAEIRRGGRRLQRKSDGLGQTQSAGPLPPLEDVERF